MGNCRDCLSGCKDSIPASCVPYNGPNIPCISYSDPVSIETLINLLGQRLCNIERDQCEYCLPQGTTEGKTIVWDGETWVEADFAQPEHQVVYGTGSGVDSSNKLLYNSSTDVLQMTGASGFQQLQLEETQSFVGLYFDDSGTIYQSNLSLQIGYLELLSSKDGVGFPLYAGIVTDVESSETVGLAVGLKGSSGYGPRLAVTKDYTVITQCEISETVQHQLRFNELPSNGSNYFAMKAADSITNNWTIIWPTDTPVAGESLKVQGVSGSIVTLEWA